MGSSFTTVARKLISDVLIYDLKMTHSLWVWYTLMIVSYHYSRVCKMWLAHSPTDTAWNCLLFVYNGWLHFNTFFVRTHLLFQESTERWIVLSVILFIVDLDVLTRRILTNSTILLGAQDIYRIIPNLWNHRTKDIILLGQHSCLVKDSRPGDVIIKIPRFHRCITFEHIHVPLTSSWI